MHRRGAPESPLVDAGADACDAYLDSHQSRFIAEMVELLSIPSVSALPQHGADVDRAAQWLEQRLLRAGLQNAATLRAGEFPVVYADWLHAPGAPTVLVYGHFDVQPAPPSQAWTSPPFEPAIRDGRVYARGATDDKGNLLVPILAIEAMLAERGSLPVNIKFLLEGEEEILSPDMPAFVRAHRERFACDLVVSADGWQWSESEGDLRVGLRGVCALEVTAYGPRQDLHSGSHGGAVANPLHGLVAALAKLHDDAGRILVPGFYEDVRELDAEERQALAAVPFDEGAYRARLGVTELVGEPGYSTRERIGARPTIEINGIVGGHDGPGVRTVVPAHATAKLTCRLVPDQQPTIVAECVRRFLLAQCPPGLRFEVSVLPNSAEPYGMPADHPGNRAARNVLIGLHGREPYYTRSGGSIPILALFKRELRAYTVIFGFGLPDEGMHGPDEFLRLSSFRLGQGAYVALLDQLAHCMEADQTHA
ncbi:MAG: dipeptidase [Burkholderiaceae bacterium]